MNWSKPIVAVGFAALSARPARSEAQAYFGRNKVQYESFKWRIIKSEHFDNFFYPSESLLVNDAARLAERWYARHSETFRHAFDRKSLTLLPEAGSWADDELTTADEPRIIATCPSSTAPPPTSPAC